MAEAVGLWLLSIVADAAKGYFSKKLLEAFEGAPPPDKVLAEVQKVLHQVDEVGDKIERAITLELDKNEFRTFVSDISTWTDRIEQVLKNASANELEDEQVFRQELRDHATVSGGITSNLTQIHNLLVQRNSVFPDGLIGAVLAKQEAIMVKDDDMNVGIDWYLYCAYSLMANLVQVQTAGLAVQLFMAAGDAKNKPRPADAAAYVSKMNDRFQEQIKFAYSRLHPFVARLKPDFQTPIDPNRWWYIIADNGLALCRDDDVVGEVQVRKAGPSEDTAWRFERPLDVCNTTALRCMASQYPLCFTFKQHDVRPIFSCRDRPPTRAEGNGIYGGVLRHAVMTVGIKPVKNEKDGTGRVKREATFRFVLMETSVSGMDLEPAKKSEIVKRQFRLEPAPEHPVLNPIPSWVVPYEGKLIHGENQKTLFVLDYVTRWVPDGEIASRLFGADWDKRVLDTPDHYLVPRGESLGHDTRLITAPGYGVEMIDNGRRRWITTPQIADRYGFVLSLAVNIGESEIQKIPSGPRIEGSSVEHLEGQVIKGVGDDALYLVLDRALRLIPSMRVYQRLFGSTPRWQELPASEVLGMPKGSLLDEGCHLATEAGRPWYLCENQKLRWITNPTTFSQYGFDPNAVERSLPKYEAGHPVGNIDMTALAGARLESLGDGKVYLVLDNALRHIPNSDVYDRLFVNKERPIKMTGQDIDRMPKWFALPDYAKTFAGSNGVIYLHDIDQKRMIRSEDTMKRYDFNWDKVDRSGSDADRLREGASID